MISESRMAHAWSPGTLRSGEQSPGLPELAKENVMHSQYRGHPAAFLHSDRICRRAYLIAGGDSRRMGRDKLFITVGNQTLLSHVHSILGNRFHEVTIVARNHEKFAELPYRVIIDSPEAQGPLAGLISALDDCPEKYCFVCAVDLPDISTEIIDRLLAAFAGEDYLGLRETAIGPDGPNARIQPLCGIYSKSVVPTLIRQASTGDYCLSDAISKLNTESIEPDSKKWRNLNYPSDVEGHLRYGC